MNRNLLINILLIIVGMVLALVLFAAGAMWRGRVRSHAEVVVHAPAFILDEHAG
jgi:hypothetical protein